MGRSAINNGPRRASEKEERTTAEPSGTGSRVERGDRSPSSTAGTAIRGVQLLVEEEAIDPKLEVGSPKCPREREADRVAKEVMLMDDQGRSSGDDDRPRQGGDPVREDRATGEARDLGLVELDAKGGGSTAASDDLGREIRSSGGVGRPLADPGRSYFPESR